MFRLKVHAKWYISGNGIIYWKVYLLHFHITLKNLSYISRRTLRKKWSFPLRISSVNWSSFCAVVLLIDLWKYYYKNAQNPLENIFAFEMFIFANFVQKNWLWSVAVSECERGTCWISFVWVFSIASITGSCFEAPLDEYLNFRFWSITVSEWGRGTC